MGSERPVGLRRPAYAVLHDRPSISASAPPSTSWRSSRNGGPSGPRPTTPEMAAGPGRLVDGTPAGASIPRRITGRGQDELAAMVDLRIRLDERRRG